MTILKSYHQKAGSYIRKLLLKELKGILQNKEDMDDVFEISLLGSESGNLMAYRVLDIAPETTPVAFTTVGLLKDIG